MVDACAMMLPPMGLVLSFAKLIPSGLATTWLVRTTATPNSSAIRVSCRKNLLNARGGINVRQDQIWSRRRNQQMGRLWGARGLESCHCRNNMSDKHRHGLDLSLRINLFLSGAPESQGLENHPLDYPFSLERNTCTFRSRMF